MSILAVWEMGAQVMKTYYQSLLLALTLAGTAFAQVPSTNDTSDTHHNTGAGTFALGGPTATNTGNDNTALGYSALNSNTIGFQNTASGRDALGSNTAGYNNSACGYGALKFNTTGNENTATGSFALYDNTTGIDNTASGVNALQQNTSGGNNTASGFGALELNMTGSDNSAFGSYALHANTTGNNNLGVGYAALFSNTTGANNTATGLLALAANTTGNNNTALGHEALNKNTTGVQNTGLGVRALYNNKGRFNTAVGYSSLDNNTRGQYNVAIGWKAGFALTTGNNNIDIDNQGEQADSDTIRIGTQGTQTLTFIAGIANNTAVTGLPVVVDGNGQLGVQSISAERFKTAITPMGANSAKLQQLRPVTFYYKADPRGTRRYGLVAEEVAKVYPELVVRDSQGTIYGVRYDELAPMMLNEMQKRNAAQDAEIRDLKQQQLRMQQQMAQLKDLNQKTQVWLRELQANDQLLTQR